VIPRANILAWQEHAPWGDTSQVEQDLILSRAIVELFKDPQVHRLLAFRGGTALHKLHLAPSARYSEDIDLVQVEAGPAKPMFRVIRECLDPWLGTPMTKTKRNGIQLLYSFATEFQPVRQMRVKVEINTREHFSELGFVTMPFVVENPWFSGTADVRTFTLNELIGTKLRALYQRKKGRDLFDVWHAFQRAPANADAIVQCFRAYLKHQDLFVSRAEFEANLDAKALDPAFQGDVRPLLHDEVAFDQAEALRLVRERFFALL
jgi:predicted nucleotidyltransferase component of viral defense system